MFYAKKKEKLSAGNPYLKRLSFTTYNLQRAYIFQKYIPKFLQTPCQSAVVHFTYPPYLTDHVLSDDHYDGQFPAGLRPDPDPDPGRTERKHENFAVHVLSAGLPGISHGAGCRNSCRHDPDHSFVVLCAV